MMNFPIIVDDYFENPHQIRKIGLDLLGKNHSCIINDDTRNYPGIRCLVPDEINQHLISSIEKIVDKKVTDFISSFHITSSLHKCGLIHKDKEGLAGLIYLNENPPENSGTILCECIDEDGHERVNDFNEASSTKDISFIKSFGEFKEQFNQENFKIIEEIENKFNRLILYDGNEYHAPYYYFGNNLFNSRLVLVFWTNYELSTAS